MYKKELAQQIEEKRRLEDERKAKLKDEEERLEQKVRRDEEKLRQDYNREQAELAYRAAQVGILQVEILRFTITNYEYKSNLNFQ